MTNFITTLEKIIRDADSPCREIEKNTKEDATGWDIYSAIMACNIADQAYLVDRRHWQVIQDDIPFYDASTGEML